MSSPPKPADAPDEVPNAHPESDVKSQDIDTSLLASPPPGEEEQASSSTNPIESFSTAEPVRNEAHSKPTLAPLDTKGKSKATGPATEEEKTTESAAVAVTATAPAPVPAPAAPVPETTETSGHVLEASHHNGGEAHDPQQGETLRGKGDPAEAKTPPLRPEQQLSQTVSIEKLTISSPPPPPPPPKDEKYLPSPRPVDGPPISPTTANYPEFNEKHDHGATTATAPSSQQDAEVLDDSRSEIASIMEQFDQGTTALGEEEIMSPRLEFAGPNMGSPILHPPRKSSLDPGRTPSISDSIHSLPPRSSSLSGPHLIGSSSTERSDPTATTAASPTAGQHAQSPNMANTMFKASPPAPDPEPTLPFDFHRFMEQLRHRTADPVAKFLRSFLLEFGKKQWMVHEQVKIIGDFLEFISRKMAQCEIWRTVSDAEFDNAREGMEKLVMNRLYTQTFSPAIPAPEPAGKGRKRGTGNLQSPIGPGRSGQHQEDVERDEVLAQKVRIYSWVKEEHLDIKPIGDKGRKFLQLAQQELLKIKSYRAPRDKVICILNCCKVIFGFLRSSQSDQSADSFVPLLIYTVLQANPDHLVSNVQYILRFRNQDKLAGEAGYYISSLMGAVQFIENLDRTSLTISDEDFEKNVEAAVSEIAERHSLEEQEQQRRQAAQQTLSPNQHHHHQRIPSPHRISEKSTISQPEVTPRSSMEGEQSTPRRSHIRSPTSDGEGEEIAAVTGLLRTIQRPLSTIGRIFSDDSPSTTTNQPALTPVSATTPRLSPAPRTSEDGRRSADREKRSGEQQQHRQSHRLSAEDAAVRQASAEAEEARRIQRQEHKVVVDTLAGMFPNLDKEVIDDVVRLNEGRVGLAVESCLALSNP